MKSVVLCADEVSLRHPECLGLAGESLHSQPWLRTFSEADAAREALRKAQEVEEVWVVSNDQVDPINLAATLKADRPDRAVFLVASSPSGSLLSRVSTAHIDGVLTVSEFVGRYALKKQTDAQAAAVGFRGPQMRVRVESAGEVSGVEPEIDLDDQPEAAQIVSTQPNSPALIKADATYEEPSFDVPSDSGVLGKFARHASSDSPRGQRECGAAPSLPGKHIGSVRSDALGKHASLEGIPLVQAPQRNGRPLTLTEQAVLAVQGFENQARCHEEAQSFAAPMRKSAGNGGTKTAIVAMQKPVEQAFLLPVVSGSGGSGKSTLAAMTALITQKAGMKTLLVDLDLQFGDMLEILGYTEALGVDALIAAPSRVKHLQAQDGGPSLLCAPSNIEQAEDLVGKVPQLLDLVMPLFDVIVVNTGSFWTELQAVLLERCSRALFVVDQRPSSLRGCLRALELCTRCGIAASPLVFAVNKCEKQALYSSIDVSCALNGAFAKEIAWGGNQVEELFAAGQAAALLNERNALVESLTAMLSELIPGMPVCEPDRLGPGRVPLLRMLMGSKSKEEQPCR